MNDWLKEKVRTEEDAQFCGGGGKCEYVSWSAGDEVGYYAGEEREQRVGGLSALGEGLAWRELRIGLRDSEKKACCVSLVLVGGPYYYPCSM